MKMIKTENLAQLLFQMEPEIKKLLRMLKKKQHTIIKKRKGP